MKTRTFGSTRRAGNESTWIGASSPGRFLEHLDELPGSARARHHEVAHPGEADATQREIDQRLAAVHHDAAARGTAGATGPSRSRQASRGREGKSRGTLAREGVHRTRRTFCLEIGRRAAHSASGSFPAAARERRVLTGRRGAAQVDSLATRSPGMVAERRARPDLRIPRGELRETGEDPRAGPGSTALPRAGAPRAGAALRCSLLRLSQLPERAPRVRSRMRALPRRAARSASSVEQTTPVSSS